MKRLTLSKNIFLATAAVVFLFSGQTFASDKDLNTVGSSAEKIQRLGFEKALEESSWPQAIKIYKLDQNGGGNGNQQVQGYLTSDQCQFDPWSPACFNNNQGSVPVNSELRDDAVQIIATEVLFQMLTYFKVKHYFGKVKGTSQWMFKVLDPVDNQPYQDLDSDTVIYAIKQFRKYVIGLICNNPDPKRVLAMMNKYDVGQRFRWDMAWALLGNDLPDSPNRFMAFGAKWQKFSYALDGIMNGSLLRVQNARGGGYAPVDPNGLQTLRSNRASIGRIANETVAILRLAGDTLAAILELICVSDLRVNAKKEQVKQTVVYKLLELKKKANDRYGPLYPVLEELGQKASAAAGTKVTVLP